LILVLVRKAEKSKGLCLKVQVYLLRNSLKNTTESF
jgi:hypothetical protein